MSLKYFDQRQRPLVYPNLAFTIASLIRVTLWLPPEGFIQKNASVIANLRGVAIAVGWAIVIKTRISGGFAQRKK